MNDLDRFAAFLRREGASYHAPPPTPSDAMWPDVSARMDAGAYNAPPPAPREAMWERIEATWASGQSVAPTAASLAADHAAAPLVPAEPAAGGAHRPARWTGKRISTGWAAGLAAAASLVLGLMLGRSYEGPGAGVTDGPSAGPAAVATQEPNIPAVPAEPAAPVEPATLAELETEPPADPRESTPATAVADAATTETAMGRERPRAEAPERVAANVRSEAPALQPETPAALASAPDAPASPPAAFARLVQPVAHYETTRHLDRAATLLTAFRIDQGTPTSQQDLARWARELLGDTRVFLDMQAPRSPLERALLEDLELVLLQISRLGPGAPDFERQLALESMEWKGTLTRLRAASATGEM
ncbi:MAG: hypothetical protein F4Z31_14930 [Gemmatimonadetes bacterium]|nr:hypothetical protein [Gemmatimonadota bacterium]MYE95049.1 hypothetical protein [Gemmatimonadota bacterium]MYJ10893.1 hypothetical protein [Gemmatimonadota bacterium]